MVFFICSHCGASLKKNKVDKHYGVQCRNAPQVSCMDCHKEFRGNEYVAHTKCITEDEKYSAKGFVPKPNSNKGECKQQEWLDVVRGVQSQGNLPKHLKTLLDSIVKFENIPRKKPKFMNFLKSNNIKLGPNDLDHLWGLLETEHKRVKENAEQSINKPTDVKSDSTTNLNSNKQNGDMPMEEDQECEATPKDKTKKRKKSKGEVMDVSETQGDESSQSAETRHETSMNIDPECEDIPKSKTKKRKSKTEAMSGSENQENENFQAAEALNQNSSMEVEKECEGTPKEKAKKKKNKKENKTEVMGDIEMHAGEQAPVEQNESISVEARTTAHSKTKEDKSEIGTEVGDATERQVPEGTQENVTLTKKQRKEKKKREKYEAELKEIENTQFNNLPLEDADEQNKKKKKSKKDKDVNGFDSNVNGVLGEQTEEISTKLKKKRHLDDDQSPEPLKKKKKESEGGQQIELCTTVDVTAENTNGLQKFHWNETILAIVRSKGGEIPVKRLRKKIVAEYQNCCGSAENEEQLTIKLNKKLPKVPGITLHKEVVKLVE